MADHAQDQILDALAQTLIDADTAAADRVYMERVDELPVGKCPAIEIEAGEEEISPAQQGSIGWPRHQQRLFLIDIRCTVAANDGYRKAAGNLAKEVEAAICASQEAQALGGKARNGVHLLRSRVEKDGKGEKALYAIVQTWGAGYGTRANAPDVPI